MTKCILFTGNANQQLGKLITKTNRKILLGNIVHKQYPSGEWYCQLQENIRGADVFLINSIVFPANDNLMQLCIMADAARRASAGRITAVIPYIGYSRQDRKDKSRVPISAKLVMDILQAAGFDRIVTMDLHAPQIQGFTNLPFDHLYFRPSLIQAIESIPVDVVVAPDVGSVKRSEDIANRIKKELAIITKKRMDATNVKANHFIGDVKDKSVLIIDDLTESAGTVIEAASICRENGAKLVRCGITHGCFTNVGFDRLFLAFTTGLIDEVFVSNCVEFKDNYGMSKWLKIIDVSPIFSKAIYSIHANESVESLFQ